MVRVHLGFGVGVGVRSKGLGFDKGWAGCGEGNFGLGGREVAAFGSGLGGERAWGLGLPAGVPTTRRFGLGN